MSDSNNVQSRIQGLSGVLTSGSHGRKFTDEEEAIIIDKMTAAKDAGETVSVADIRNAIKAHNEANGDEERTRAAVVNAIKRLDKAGKVDEAVLDSKGNGRVQYSDAEDQVLADALQAAADKGEEISLPDLTKALKESGVSPKERSLPSVRAHITNLMNKGKEEAETETEAAEEDVA